MKLSQCYILLNRCFVSALHQQRFVYKWNSFNSFCISFRNFLVVCYYYVIQHFEWMFSDWGKMKNKNWNWLQSRKLFKVIAHIRFTLFVSVYVLPATLNRNMFILLKKLQNLKNLHNLIFWKWIKKSYSTIPLSDV